jgi:hypothetical protein
VEHIELPRTEDRVNGVNIYAAVGHEFAHAYYGRVGIPFDCHAVRGASGDDEVNGPCAIGQENIIRGELHFSPRAIPDPWR